MAGRRVITIAHTHARAHKHTYIPLSLYIFSILYIFLRRGRIITTSLLCRSSFAMPGPIRISRVYDTNLSRENNSVIDSAKVHRIPKGRR